VVLDPAEQRRDVRSALGGERCKRHGRAVRAPERVIVVAMLLMLAGTLILLFVDGLPSLVAARLLQGAGAALSVGAISATFTERYQGRIAPGQARVKVDPVESSPLKEIVRAI